MADVSVLERIRGTRIETGANEPLALNDPERVYYVERGHLDVFVVESDTETVVGRRRFVARVYPGQMAFGTKPVAVPGRTGHAFGLLAVPAQEAVIVRGDRAGVGSVDFDLATTDWIDEWISHLSEFLARDLPPQPQALLLEADPDVLYPAASVLTAQHLDVIWVSANRPVRFLGREDLVVAPGEALLPLSERTWLDLGAETEVSAAYTPTALVRERLWPAFDRFGEHVLEFARLTEREAAESLAARRRDRREAQRGSVARALRGLGRILRRGEEQEGTRLSGHTRVRKVLELVADSIGAPLDPPRSMEESAAGTSLEMIELWTRRARIQSRWVKLSRKWWRRAGPSMIGFRLDAEGDADAERPLALLSDDRGGYRAVDPETGTRFAVGGGTVGAISRDALVLYAPLPAEIKKLRDVLRFSMHGRGRDFKTMIALGTLGGLAALLTPILTGQLLVEIIPRGDMSLWLVSFFALVMVALGIATFEIVRGLASLRIESRVDERLQAALWGRLISLPAPFFRRFTAGDLASRANGAAAIRQALTGAAVQAAMGGIFSVSSLALLLYYSVELTLLVTGILVLQGVGNWLLSLGQLRHNRKAFEARGELSGFVFQVISGLAKLRVAHAEGYALSHWARLYRRQKGEELASRYWAAGQQVLGGLFQPFSLIVIFAAIRHMLAANDSSFDLVDYLSFNAAFGQLAGAVGALTWALTAIINVIPVVERARPILDAEPEAISGIDPGEIKGDIEFDDVSFRYAPDRPNAVDGVSFKIRPGDYVAFVGPSGCGKSTLYRLLVGFETPDSGTVFLDGHDLTSLDMNQVRGRMGVVLQQGQIVAGTIYENIAGLSPLSAAEAWAAAREAALEDDIRKMPMGMRTRLSEGGGGLSVGQKQRLLIARALARNPRVLLFDEATSALDNRSQAVVQESLRKRGVTRLVIAHRLSSIRHVDRVYVLDEGRIVEHGAYAELMRQAGVFATLARRQLIDD